MLHISAMYTCIMTTPKDTYLHVAVLSHLVGFGLSHPITLSSWLWSLDKRMEIYIGSLVLGVIHNISTCVLLLAVSYGQQRVEMG